jgi:Tat protein secretion system quality control protein TatD with DNase activity
VAATARQMAEVRQLSLEELARAAWENSLRAFGLEEKDVLGE